MPKYAAFQHLRDNAEIDRMTFERVMRSNNQRLYRTVRAMVRSDDEAEDIVQETYVKAFRAWNSFEGRARVSSWITRIAINETLDRQRHRRPTEPLNEASNILPIESHTQLLGAKRAVSANPESATARQEIRRYLEKAIDALPTALGQVFALRALQEMSTQDVAELLNIQPQTVKTRYHRAKTLLRNSVDDEIHAALQDTFPFAGARCDRIVARVLTRLEQPEKE